MELVQVETRIDVPRYDPMTRRNPASRYWKVFSEWKKKFKELNLELLSATSKSDRLSYYTAYFGEYYKQYYTAS